MRKTFAAILSAAAAWLLLLSMLLTGVFLCTTSRAFYRYEYAKNDNAAVIGISDEDLMEVTEGLLDYLWGKRDNLDMQAEIQGEMREVFSQREKDHMVDVRFLIVLARNALFICLPAGIILWVLAALIVYKQKRGLMFAGIGYLAGAALLFAAVGIVVLLAMRDFTAVFVKFHEIFFTNDLWLLNWDDMLIMMVPEPFFIDCAVLIAIVFGAGLLVTSVIALLMIVLRKKQPEAPVETTISEIAGDDGDNFYRIENAENTVRLNAEEIFARLGLNDEDDADAEEESVEVFSEEEPFEEFDPLLNRTIVQPVEAQFPVTTPDGSELNVRFEMKLDLKVEKNAEGKMVLTMNPDCKPQVSLSSTPGQLSFTIYEERAALPPVYVPQPRAIAPERRTQPIEGPVPTPDELLRQMDDLMKGFPKDSKEGEQ